MKRMKFLRKKFKNQKNKMSFASKNFFIVTIAFLGFAFSADAQEISPNAIGLRFGDNDGFGAEISYQRELGDAKRLELDLGFRDNRNFDVWKLTGIYQWVWNIDGNFNWYAGVGAGIGNVDIKDFDDDDGFFVNAVGNVGVEYNFDIPLLISIDFRPEVGLVNSYYDDLGVDLALSLRYQF